MPLINKSSHSTTIFTSNSKSIICLTISAVWSEEVPINNCSVCHVPSSYSPQIFTFFTDLLHKHILLPRNLNFFNRFTRIIIYKQILLTSNLYFFNQFIYIKSITKSYSPEIFTFLTNLLVIIHKHTLLTRNLYFFNWFTHIIIHKHIFLTRNLSFLTDLLVL
jgi:hypothetical protein